MTQLTMPVSQRDHIAGPESTPVTLVEYGDYECPHCGAAYPIVKEIQRRMGDRLRFVFRNFPLSQIHPHAEHAALAAETAGTQNHFWEMHDWLFEHQTHLGDRQLVRAAAALGLDEARFEREIAARTYEPRVREDFMSGVRSGVNGTPTFFINGTRHDESWDLETLLAALEAAEEHAVARPHGRST
jgi:protein-disulfide isomerase